MKAVKKITAIKTVAEKANNSQKITINRDRASARLSKKGIFNPLLLRMTKWDLNNIERYVFRFFESHVPVPNTTL